MLLKSRQRAIARCKKVLDPRAAASIHRASPEHGLLVLCRCRRLRDDRRLPELVHDHIAVGLGDDALSLREHMLAKDDEPPRIANTETKNELPRLPDRSSPPTVNDRPGGASTTVSSGAPASAKAAFTSSGVKFRVSD